MGSCWRPSYVADAATTWWRSGSRAAARGWSGGRGCRDRPSGSRHPGPQLACAGSGRLGSCPGKLDLLPTLHGHPGLAYGRNALRIDRLCLPRERYGDVLDSLALSYFRAYHFVDVGCHAADVSGSEPAGEVA